MRIGGEDGISIVIADWRREDNSVLTSSKSVMMLSPLCMKTAHSSAFGYFDESVAGA